MVITTTDMSRYPNDRDSSGWSASAYQSAASFVYAAAQTANVMGMLDPKQGECIVDWGCGSGEVTKEIINAVSPGGEVVGVDISESMVGRIYARFRRDIDRFVLLQYR